MSLSLLLDAVTRDLPRYAPAYAAARARLAVLEPYPTTDALLAALKRSAATAKKGELVELLHAQAQQAAHPLWNALLVAAFAPMLVRLRQRSRRSDEAESDQDQAVLLAFLDAIRTVKPSVHSATGLAWKTEGAVFGRTRADREAPPTEAFDAEVHAESPFAFEQRESSRTAAMEIVSYLHAHGAAEGLDILLCTEALDEPLCEYAARSSASREATTPDLSRLARLRNQAAHKAAARFGRPCRAA